MPSGPSISTLLLLALASAVAFTVPRGLETNEIEESRQVPLVEKSLPVCKSNSVCAFLQANSGGLNVKPLCSCPGYRVCPLYWDSMDGQSITQGSDQYKYCDRAPERRLCSNLELAYTSVLEYSRTTEELEAMADFIHCICPEHYTYHTSDTQFDETEHFDIIKTRLICQPLNVCEASKDTCRVITETTENFLVNTKCVCPHSEVCPSNPRFATETMTIGSGKLHLMRCRAYSEPAH